MFKNKQDKKLNSIRTRQISLNLSDCEREICIDIQCKGRVISSFLGSVQYLHYMYIGKFTDHISSVEEKGLKFEWNSQF